jgi:hypothetical protein
VTKTFTAADMVLREMLRRRSVLVLLLLLPLAFYLSRRGDHLGQSIRFVCLGLGWALSTAALFAGNAARTIEPRHPASGSGSDPTCCSRHRTELGLDTARVLVSKVN